MSENFSPTPGSSSSPGGAPPPSSDREASRVGSWQTVRAEPDLTAVWLDGKLYTVARRQVLSLGFNEWLLGAGYAEDFYVDPAWPQGRHPYVVELLQRQRRRARFYVICQDQHRDAAGHLIPLFTVFKSDAGQVVILERHPELAGQEDFLVTETLYSLVIAQQPFSRHQYDAYGDFMRLGAFSVVDRHSSELVAKHVANRICFDALSCTHCLKCATACSEMRAAITANGLRLLGPAEQYCTACRLCLEHCPHLIEVRKEELPPELRAAPQKHFTGGEATYLTGPEARRDIDFLHSLAARGGMIGDWELKPVYQGDSMETPPDGPPCQVRQYLWQRREQPKDGRPLLITGFLPAAESSEPPLVIRRRQTQVAVYITTEAGEIEQDLGRRLERLGVLFLGAIDRQKRGLIRADHPAVQKFYQHRRLRPDSDLEELVQAGQVDVILTPYRAALPPEVQAYFLHRTGNMAHLLAPQPYEAFTFSHEPLLNELRELCLAVFPRYSELLAAEAELARTYLSDLPRHSAEIHARYRTWGIAPGHSACPTCAELQVLSIPLYMAMVLSLARREVPQVTFTCETGCMSETLNKVNEVAQKVKGGRTVYGGGFALGEAVAMAEEWAISRGVLKKGRRYVVSQSGDGGSVIGLPAWLNALRQKAFLIKERHANVLHFINVTDTQVYSNTGGESSASSLLGMSTLTTPMGRFLVGNQRIQWNLINLAAEFPGILVGCGHSGNKLAAQEFWAEADRLGRTAIRWDVTPCPETGKFFGEDPDRLAWIMAQAGMLPEVVFVGRLRKRVAPINPADRGKNWRDWSSQPQPIYYWLSQDPRYRALIRKNPITGEWEPLTPAVRFIIAQLERYRDNLNRQIDLENRLVREAEEYTEEFFAHLAQEWLKHRQVPEEFPYHFLFNDQGKLKPEFGPAFKQDFMENIIGQDYLTTYSVRRQQHLEAQAEALETALATGAPGPEFGIPTELPRPLPFQSLRAREQEGRYESVAEARQAEFYRVLDQLLNERAIAQQSQISQYVLKKELARDFLAKGGLFSRRGAAVPEAERRQFRGLIKALGDFAIGVSSLAGERGIAINRVFSHFFTEKGAWAGMAWQFGSSKRGTPVFSGTFVSPRPIIRKDAVHSYPFYVLTVTNYEDLKGQPDVFYDNLHPRGYLIVNTPKSPEVVRNELLAQYDELTRRAVTLVQEVGPEEKIEEKLCRFLFETPYAARSPEQHRQIQKILALGRAHIITTDMDAIMAAVAGTTRVVSNLVAVAPMMRALELLGLPVDLKKDLPVLTSGFPGAVLKKKALLEQYVQAMLRAIEEAQGFPEQKTALVPTLEGVAEDPADYYMEMGGTVAGMVMSQLATETHPLYYVGFPITPAGNPFYAMAQAYANGHPYITVDEMNPSEKVAAEKLLGLARAGGVLPVTFTASQGWRLFAEIMPQLVGARLECLFVLTRRALAAPALNIEESHTDFMTFRDDGAIMLSPKSVQELVPCLYLARLLTHFARLPVVASMGGVTDTHKIGLVRVPPDHEVRAWLDRVLHDFDFLEDKLLNQQGERIVHGPSGTNEVYQETQSEVEKAHAVALQVYPYAVAAVKELTGYTFDALELCATGSDEPLTSALILTGSFYPNAEEAIQELAQEGWRELGAVSVRLFNPFPEAKLARLLEKAQVVTVLDRSNSFGSVPPLASRVLGTLARWRSGPMPVCRCLVGGLGGREITVSQIKEIIKFSHLLLGPRAPEYRAWRETIIKQDPLLQGLMAEIAALEKRAWNRHTRVPASWQQAVSPQTTGETIKARLHHDLVQGNYREVLATYGAVEFVAPREVWQESDLAQSLVLRLEMLLAQALITRGRADGRAALVLLEYGQTEQDFRRGLAGLEQVMATASPERAWAWYRLGRSYQPKFAPFGLSLSEPDVPAPIPVAAHSSAATEIVPAAPGPPSRTAALEFSAAEAARLQAVIRQLVHESAYRETLRNPEDLERDALHYLRQDPDSQLYGRNDRAWLESYRQCYSATIDRALYAEILVTHYAPELRQIFFDRGWQALALVVKAATAYHWHNTVDPRPGRAALAQAVSLEVERYLRQEVYPQYRRPAGFYHDFYRAVVEPQVREAIAQEVEKYV